VPAGLYSPIGQDAIALDKVGASGMRSLAVASD
jgi:hypothetical protein